MDDINQILDRIALDNMSVENRQLKDRLAQLEQGIDRLRMNALAMPSGKIDADWIAQKLAALLEK